MIKSNKLSFIEGIINGDLKGVNSKWDALERRLKMIKQFFMKHREIILYMVVGGLTTGVNWIAYAFSTLYLPITDKERLVFVSGAIAWVAAVLFAYVTNKRWVFESKKDNVKELFKEFAAFVGARSLTGVMEIVGVPFLVFAGLNQRLFDVEGFWAKVVVTVVVMILNYVFSKLFIFRKKTKQEEATAS